MTLDNREFKSDTERINTQCEYFHESLRDLV
jgi:hypothetical protein